MATQMAGAAKYVTKYVTLFNLLGKKYQNLIFTQSNNLYHESKEEQAYPYMPAV